MGTSVPTTTTDRDWGRIDAGHQAVDQLNQIIGELRGTLDHDPHAAGRLRTALAILLGDQDTPKIGHDIVVVDNPGDRLLTVTPKLEWFDGIVPVITVTDDWDPNDRPESIALGPDDADALADALHAAASSARQAEVTR